MQASIQATRLILKLGWLVPVAWLVGSGLSGSVGVLLPVYLFIVAGLALIPVTPTLDRLWSNLNAGLLAPLRAISLCFAAVIVVIVSVFAEQGRITLPVLLANWLLMIAVGLLVSRILDQDVDYEGVMGDFRLGVVGTAILLGIAYKADSHAHFNSQVFAGVVAYGLLGVFALAFARRYAIGEDNNDERTQVIQGDWLLSVLLLVGILGVVALLLAQLFAFDIISALGQLTSPFRNATIDAMLFLLTQVIRFLAWVTSFLDFHRAKPPTPHPVGPPKNPFPTFKSHHVKPNPLPVWLETLLKALGITILGAVILAILAIGLRVTARARRPRVTGELRINSWSWRKMGSWFLGHGRRKLGVLLEDLKPHVPRRQVMRSVRDVYRAFLLHGSRHARPRKREETGLEYSHDLSILWPDSRDRLDHLNELYLAERYGLQPATAETVNQAKADLKAVQVAGGHPSEPVEV